MTARIIDGKALAAAVYEKVGQEAGDFRVERGRSPALAVIKLGNDPASDIYVRNKRRKSQEVGIISLAHDLPAETNESAVLDLIAQLNLDPKVDGILVQLPLPSQVRAENVLLAIAPAKDVDGFHPQNQGKLLAGCPQFIPCTPAGIMEIIRSTHIVIPGRKAVVVGRSNIVGKPTALLLLQEHATVTICHSRTQDLAAECRNADILVVAIGRRALIRGDWIKPGALVIDVGINREKQGLGGDVDFDQARERAGFITPVPGGVGPMTIAMLMSNTMQAARRGEG
ncbi:bifunctional methylenetetrahydrofolate dehydrogenase/methenyltetrahydrofolate cyclohydrolase FolD [bacterium]|nr:bifunctional methylenetetrahydrofolate dehydrogenase/methenyltetrahydrofolate cyclohydrolase FolD [bacterium]